MEDASFHQLASLECALAAMHCYPKALHATPPTSANSPTRASLMPLASNTVAPRGVKWKAPPATLLIIALLLFFASWKRALKAFVNIWPMAVHAQAHRSVLERSTNGRLSIAPASLMATAQTTPVPETHLACLLSNGFQTNPQETQIWYARLFIHICIIFSHESYPSNKRICVHVSRPIRAHAPPTLDQTAAPRQTATLNLQLIAC